MHIASLAVCMLLVLASLPAAAAGKKYFLTPEAFAMGDVRDACGKGYHVASLWEIFDFTALQYDTKRGHALMTGSGGPPSDIYGWIETAGDDSASTVVGFGNCLGFTSSDAGDYGTVVRFPTNWAATPTVISPWDGGTSTCNVPRNVWCKQD